ncbi:MAG TPA: phytanoyl-CoA dioxygenase family protein [Acidimicrobiales bacterium]|nr:phytanoyl-CoA dioxygenase family protein [Acidimicrobiales bacterium]
MPVHPWNKEFTWQTPPGPYRRITDAQARQWDDDGYFLLEDALDPDALARVTEAIDPFEERSTEWLREQGGTMFIADADAITFTTHLVTRSPVVREFAASDAFADLNHDLIGPDTRLYWDQAVYKKPESPKEFPWHQDNGYTFVEPQQYLTCWVPLVDATVDNGCPWVAPGKHREGTLEHWLTPVGFQCLENPVDAVPVEAPAGSVVVFSSLTPHRTGPNVSTATRKAYILQYAPDGAIALKGDAPAPPAERLPQDDPDRQFAVLRDGVPA